MYLSAYDTPMGSKIIIDDIKEAIVKSLIMGNMEVKIDGEYYYRNTGILLVTANNKEIKPFSHPISVIKGTEEYLAIDVRHCTRMLTPATAHISNSSDFNFIYTRAKLQKLFTENPRQLLSRGGVFPMLTYARWISETLGKVLGLSAEDQFKICIVAGIWFMSLFQETPMTEPEMQKAGILVSRSTRIPSGFTADVIKEIDQLFTTQDFVSTLIKVVNSPRMADFTAGAFYAFMSNGWLSSLYKPMVATAIDHVPTWFTLVLMSLSDKGATRTNIAKLIQNNAKGNNPQSFVLAITSMMGK